MTYTGRDMLEIHCKDGIYKLPISKWEVEAPNIFYTVREVTDGTLGYQGRTFKRLVVTSDASISDMIKHPYSDYRRALLPILTEPHDTKSHRGRKSWNKDSR